MKKTTVKVISFLSGLTLAAVILTVTINNSPKIRNEIESQINSVLKTTRSLVDTYKSVASKSKSAASLLKGDKGEKTLSEEAAEKEANALVDSQWDAIERQTKQ